MSVRLNQLVTYEKRLMADRKQLLELIEECNLNEEQDSSLLRYKLESFQKELQYLERQTMMLKNELTAREELRERATEAKAQTGEAAQKEESKVAGRQNAETLQEPVKEAISTASRIRPVPEQKVPIPFVKANAKDLEKTIGKSLMGIFASVLIFISLILFATLLLPYFNDTAKMITTYVISFVFLGVGLFKLKKDSENKFFVALTGCGMGALYISMLLSNIYFKVLGDIPLYILIGIWGICIGVFSKKRSKIFQAIGESGILIATVFGCILCTQEQDVVKFIALVIFYAISFIAFYVIHYQKEFIENLMHHIFNVLNLFILAVTAFELSLDSEVMVGVWMVFVLLLVSFGCTLWHKAEKEAFSIYIFAIIYMIMCYVVLKMLCEEWSVWGIIAYATSVLLMALFQWKKTVEEDGKYAAQWILYIIAIIAVNCWENGFAYGAIPLLILPAMIAGFLLKNIVFKYGGLLVAAGYLFFVSDINLYVHYLLCLLVVATGHYLMYWKKEQYNAAYKICIYLLTLLTLFYIEPVFSELFGSDDWSGLCTYIVVVTYNIFMMKGMLTGNLKTGNQDISALYHITNLGLMLVGLSFAGDSYESAVIHILWIMVTLVTFLVNSKNYLDKRDSMAAGIYVGVKLAVFMVVVLNSFEAVNYVISISCLLFAIASIIIGFAGEYKSLRIFGLVLSMISIFKLIMVDISYENTLGNALSFFVSGILCFVISLIYNYIDKKMQERA